MTFGPHDRRRAGAFRTGRPRGRGTTARGALEVAAPRREVAATRVPLAGREYPPASPSCSPRPRLRVGAGFAFVTDAFASGRLREGTSKVCDTEAVRGVLPLELLPLELVLPFELLPLELVLPLELLVYPLELSESDSSSKSLRKLAWLAR